MKRLLLGITLSVSLIVVIATVQAQQPDQSGYTVSVMGQVKMAGMYRVRSDRTLTLLQAIALAQGLTDRADRKKVEITRNDAQEKITIDLDAVMSGRAADVAIKAGDVIRVPELPSRLIATL